MTGSPDRRVAVRGRLRITERAVRRIVATAVESVPGTISLGRSGPHRRALLPPL